MDQIGTPISFRGDEERRRAVAATGHWAQVRHDLGRLRVRLVWHVGGRLAVCAGPACSGPSATGQREED